MCQTSNEKIEREGIVKNKYPLFVHLFRDNIFIDTIIQQFIDLEIESKFLCYSKTGSVNFIKMKKEIEIFNNLEKLGKFIKNMPQETVFFLHSRCFSYIYINKYLKKFRVVWSTWGGDIYKDNRELLSLNLLSIPMYKDKTRRYECWNKPIKERVKDIIRYIVYYFPSKKFYASMQYISCVLPNEFELLKEKKESFVPIPLRYLKQETYKFQLEKKEIISQKKILINNSGAITGNHVDILYHIKDFIDESTIIYIPFSYGGTEKYYNFLQTEIKKMKLEKNVIFLKEFLEYEEYLKLLSQCTIAIFGHIRQQAIGNVLLMLRLRAKVFFFEDSISYKYFNKIGIQVFDLIRDFNNEIIKTCDTIDEDITKKINEISNYETYLIDFKKSLSFFDQSHSCQ